MTDKHLAPHVRGFALRDCRTGALIDSTGIRQLTGKITRPETCPGCGHPMAPFDAAVTGQLVGVA